MEGQGGARFAGTRADPRQRGSSPSCATSEPDGQVLAWSPFSSGPRRVRSLAFITMPHSNRLLQGGLAALFLVCASAASAAPQDGFEPNNSCGAASLIPLGTQINLTVGPDDDYYTVRIEDNSEIVAVALDAAGDPLNIQLLEAGCGTTIATGTNAPVRYFDCGGVARDVVLFVPGIGLTDEPYSLTVE